MLLFQELVFSLPLPFWWSSSHQPATGIRFSKMNASPTKDIILMINDWHSSTRLPAMPKIYKFILFSIISVILFFCMLEESLPPFHSYFLIACIPCTSTTPSVNWYSHYPVICCHTTHTKQIVRPCDASQALPTSLHIFFFFWWSLSQLWLSCLFIQNISTSQLPH